MCIYHNMYALGLLYTMMMFSAALCAIAIYSPLEYRRLEDEMGEEASILMPKTIGIQVDKDMLEMSNIIFC